MPQDTTTTPTRDTYPIVESAAAGNRWSNFSGRTKRMIIIIAGIGIIPLLALVILVVVLAVEGRCSLSPRIPSLGKPRAVYTTPDVTNLVRFKGYLQVYDIGFLQLDIKRINVRKEERIITLEDDCVMITMSYTKNTDESSVSLFNLKWSFTDANDASPDDYMRCGLKTPIFYHTYPLGYHYSCLQRQVHLCHQTGYDGQTYAAAELVIESLELELDGDDEQIYRGEFSKPPYEDSCIGTR